MSDYLVELPMYITKATSDGRTMRWAAVNSDTDKDSYLERMSRALYEDFIFNIKNEIPVPEIFRNEVCSDYWCGGMPYVSISHYSDLNGNAVPGEPLELYIDGNEDSARLKAKGILFDSPLGHSVYRALKEDKVKNPDNKIRISIGFLDLAHKHGEDGELFVRDSLTSACPQCAAEVGDKIYVKGYLVHLALTRVPVNKRTEMVLEEKSMPKKTRKEDAESIVGKDLAEEIEQKNKVVRSDVLVEMSENDDVENKSDDTLSTSVNDPETTEKEEKTEKELVLDSGAVEEKTDAYNLPYGGATSMKEAMKAQAAKEEIYHVMDMFSIFQSVVWNIVDRSDVENKKAAVEKAIDEFKSTLAAKAMVMFSEVPKEDVEEEVHPLQSAIDALLENIDNSAQLKADTSEKLQSINPALQEFGTAITDYVSKSASDEPAPAPNINETLQNALRPLVEAVNGVSDRLSALELKSNASSVESRSRIPQPRTNVVPPGLTQKSVEKAKPGSLRDIINKSVGFTE